MAGYKTFVAGEEALAADINSYLMAQTIPRFANASARTAALTAPVINQLSMLDTSPGVINYWTGSAWADIPGGQWTAYSPTFAGNTGASTIGNGTLLGRFAIIGQKTCLGQVYFLQGSSTAFNAGTVRFGLPVAASVAIPQPTLGPAGVGIGPNFFSGYAYQIAANALAVQGPYITSNCNVAPYTNTNFTQAGNFAQISFQYEIA